MILKNINKGSLQGLVDSVVAFYRDDFKTDQSLFRNASAFEKDDERVFIWLLRSCGTNLMLLKNAFIEGTTAYQTIRYYAEQDADKNSIKAFCVKIRYCPNAACSAYFDLAECETLVEELYSIDLKKMLSLLDDNSVYSDGYKLHYEKGEKTLYELTGDDLFGKDSELGNFIYFEAVPQCEELVREGMDKVLKLGMADGEMGLNVYIKKLRREIVEAEADRIRNILDMLFTTDTLNSPDGLQYMAEVSNSFAMLAGSSEMDYLMDLLSDIQGAYLSSLVDRSGIFVFVPKAERSVAV